MVQQLVQQSRGPSNGVAPQISSILEIETPSCLRETQQKRWGASPRPFRMNFQRQEAAVTPNFDDFWLSFGTIRCGTILRAPDIGRQSELGGTPTLPGPTSPVQSVLWNPGVVFQQVGELLGHGDVASNSARLAAHRGSSVKAHHERSKP